MHQLLLTIMAAVALTTIAAGQSCECNFKGQASGPLKLTAREAFKNLFYPYNFNKRVKYEVDFGLKRARIYYVADKGFLHAGISDFFQDLENNTIYRIPYVWKYDNVIRNYTVEKHKLCLSMKMTDAIRFPTCLPAGLNKRLLTPTEYVYEPTKNSYYDNRFTLDRYADCKLVDAVVSRQRNATMTTTLELYVYNYKLLHTFGDDFFADTKDCQPANDWDHFFFSDYFVSNE